MYIIVYGYESWTIKKAEHWRTDAFKLWCWKRLLSKEIKPIWKKINPEYVLEGLCWSSNILATWCEEPAHWKRPWCWERLRAGGEGEVTEDEMVGWHHQFNGHEFEQTLGDSEGQGSLECWGHKESDMTERLKNKQQKMKALANSKIQPVNG